MKKKMTKNRAFTLIEVLVVATIIGILVTVTAVSFAKSQKRSRDARRKADLETVRQALVLYRQDHGSYGNANSFSEVITYLAAEGYLTSNTMNDPKTPGNYYAWCPGYLSNCPKVTLMTVLESDYSEYTIYTP